MQLYISFMEFLPLIGAGISAATNLIGGNANREAQERFNASQIDQAEKNRAAQYEFAQKGIGWKAQDAIANGISPLYALGAQTTSYSPVSLGGGVDTSAGSAIASSGQDISRALNATATAAGRSTAFTKALEAGSLTKLDLENQLLASKIAQLKTQNPPMPAVPGVNVPEAKEPEDRPILSTEHTKWSTHPGSTNAEDFEKRYGDIGENVAGAMNMWSDAKSNLGNPATWPKKAAQYMWDAAKRDALQEWENAKSFGSKLSKQRWWY